MIGESEYWKNDLLRFADYLDRRREARRWTERAAAKIEKAVMVGCFSIRRLIESKGRLSDLTIRRRVRVTLYPKKAGTRVTLLNWLRLDRHFALHSPRRTTLALADLCNQFIHSYVFMPVTNLRGRLRTLLVASERTRTKALYEVSIDEIIRIFRRVGKDDPDVVRSTFDEEQGDYIVRAWTTKVKP